MKENALEKFRHKFIEEVNMLSEKLESEILELETSPDDEELRESVFRAMHTIKGISAMYGFQYISDFTHLLENIFQLLRDKKLRFTKELSDISLKSIDHIRKLLEDEKFENADNKRIHYELIDQIENLEPSEKKEIAPPQPVSPVKATEDGVSSWYIIVNSSEQMYFRGISLVNILNELSQLGKYKIRKIPVLSETETDCWGIVLATSATLDEIKEVFMFIEDDCSILRLSKNDIFEQSVDIESEQAIVNLVADTNEPSLLDLIERGDSIEVAKNAEKTTTDKILKSKRITVDTSKLDNLMILVSQLVTLNAQISQATREKNYEKQLDYMEILDSLSKQFRTGALELRLVPLSDLAIRFQRLIRDLSRTLEKKIEFVTEGIDTELDKSIIDGIAEPLMHLIRNCIDHGIETPAFRKMNKKPETGTIRLSACYSGAYVVIKVEDDGNGIDLEKVRKKAVEKGILKASDKPTSKELFDIIFLSGFSTAQSLTEVSGRGVGMDAVKRSINELRGEIDVESTPGKGSTFTIRLNQSLAITDALLFKVEKTNFIVSISEIEECREFENEHEEKYERTSTIPFNGSLIPCVDLRKHLGITGSYKPSAKTIVLRNGSLTLAIMADAIIGEHQAVLKPVHHTFDDETCLTAVSQLGNGALAFYIDTPFLYKQINYRA